MGMPGYVSACASPARNVLRPALQLSSAACLRARELGQQPGQRCPGWGRAAGAARPAVERSPAQPACLLRFQALYPGGFARNYRQTGFELDGALAGVQLGRVDRPGRRRQTLAHQGTAPSAAGVHRLPLHPTMHHNRLPRPSRRGLCLLGGKGPESTPHGVCGARRQGPAGVPARQDVRRAQAGRAGGLQAGVLRPGAPAAQPAQLNRRRTLQGAHRQVWQPAKRSRSPAPLHQPPAPPSPTHPPTHPAECNYQEVYQKWAYPGTKCLVTATNKVCMGFLSKPVARQ